MSINPCEEFCEFICMFVKDKKEVFHVFYFSVILTSCNLKSLQMKCICMCARAYIYIYIYI